MQWGPKGSQPQNSPPIIGVTKFHAANLKPSTTYQFRVHECDRIACSPWSDLLTLETQAGGSNAVTIYMDNNMAQKIGTGTVLPNGSFNIKATIPANTAPGTHTITAAIDLGPAKNIAGLRNPSNPGTPASATPKASLQLTVTGPGGAGAAAGSGGASISVMNTQTRTAMKPPINLLYPSTFRLRGNGFAPAATVTVHLDTATGPQLGSAVPNKLGVFAGNFKLPMTQSGPHTLVAVQVAGGRTVQASETVQLASQPK
jgi:hypothetical protein